MSAESHSWKIGKDPPLIRPHSLAKHRVLKSYLERYVAVLTSNPRREQLRLTLVDGFAGGGIYLDNRSKEERPGSPLIMLDAMQSAATNAQQARSKCFHLDVEYFFIEMNPESFEYLTKTLADSPYASLLPDRIRLLNGDFTAHVQEIIRFIKGRGRAGRAIFVLDQCGYIDAPMETIHTILDQLDNAEVILTFATDFLIDYLSQTEQTQQILETLGIKLPLLLIKTAKEGRDWRRVIQFALHRQIHVRSGAMYYTPFFIRSPESHRDFWLIHLSGHFRARDVMVGLHWQQSTDFAHYGRAGLRMLGYDPEKDSDWTKQKMLPGFFFDETALAASQDELLVQLPEQIHPFRGGIPFNELFAKITNDSPVTSDIMKGVLSDLAAEGQISVKDKSGLVRRKKVAHGSDVIIPSRQTRLFFSKQP